MHIGCPPDGYLDVKWYVNITLRSSLPQTRSSWQDNSDPQYHTFRSNLPALLALASAHLVSSLISTHLSPSSIWKTRFITTFSIIMIFILHGFSCFKILFILFLNYRLSTMAKSGIAQRLWPAGVIIGNMVLLFLNHKFEGYSFASFHLGLEYLVSHSVASVKLTSG